MSIADIKKSEEFLKVKLEFREYFLNTLHNFNEDKKLDCIAVSLTVYSMLVLFMDDLFFINTIKGEYDTIFNFPVRISEECENITFEISN